ncbi:MAG: UDP-N-acetylmuramoyl-L-alanine--D-glutamate ligase [Lachnospiraceae bacterium]|nr:UDP-N-acetylmuramoyl-L-alanine--D-glutamate ligase [Lachnospiraceae bacterium]
MDALKEKKYLVVGSGISGIAAVKLLNDVGVKNITLLEGNINAKQEDIFKKLNGLKPELIIGKIPEDRFDTFDIAVLSPGVSLEQDWVEKLKENNVTIWGELELGYTFFKGKLLAITGTNGKTTTTALTGAIMREYFDSVFVVGNIGLPYTEYALQMKDESVTVAEVSSFQLETIQDFKPDVSAVLNLTPDHLNRHHTMENYAACKFRICENQAEDEYIVLNYEDELIRELAKNVKNKIFWFSSERKLDEGIYLDGEEIIYVDDVTKETIKVCTIHDMKLLGKHNYENVMAAVAIAMKAGVDIESIRKAVREFDAVEHRIEFVKEVDSVKYYNDSKGTNTDAAIKAVEAMITPTIVIGGGYDKQSEYDDWILSFKDKIKLLVLIGETANKIEACARKHGFNDIVRADSLEEAVLICRDNAKPGMSVLLSPACASWDMFKSYEERGKIFKECVNKL